jgi:hypothetical protein
MMDKRDQSGYVFTDLEYGFYLETVLNRPFLEPAKQKKAGEFRELVEIALKEQVKKA